jgi:hypothetical protein
MKRFRDAQNIMEPQELRDYISDLEQYLSQREIPFLDFSQDSRVLPEHFGVGDHLDPKRGRPVFTKILADEMEKAFVSSPPEAGD